MFENACKTNVIYEMNPFFGIQQSKIKSPIKDFSFENQMTFWLFPD